MPPIVQRVCVEGSGPYRRPYGAAGSCSAACTTPGSTRAVRATVSISSTRSSRRVSTTMPSPTALPAIDVPAPRMVTDDPAAAATSSTASSSSRCRGRATAAGSTR